MLIRRHDTESTDDNVTRLPERLRVQLTNPQRFNDARHIADCLKRGSPVFVDLRDADGHLDGRLQDFSIGLAAGLGGTVGRVGDRVLLLVPPGIELSGTEEGQVYTAA
jgi:cell division inhibitor SepF